jgi:hypothetical protein
MSGRQTRVTGKEAANSAEAVIAFEALVSAAGYLIEVDKPANEAAEWFIDIEKGAFRQSLSWQSGRGFGFYTGEVGYGDKPNEWHPDAARAFDRLRHCRTASIDV